MTRVRIILILGLVLTYSCDKNIINENVIGKYKNTFESNTIHYVELKPDSTFIHYYKRGEEAAKENKGIWQLSVRPKKTEIVFNTWVDFGYIDEPICNGCLRVVKLKESEMIFNVDLPNEMNFKKEE